MRRRLRLVSALLVADAGCGGSTDSTAHSSATFTATAAQRRRLRGDPGERAHAIRFTPATASRWPARSSAPGPSAQC
jgi:hypothetical protein